MSLMNGALYRNRLVHNFWFVECMKKHDFEVVNINFFDSLENYTIVGKNNISDLYWDQTTSTRLSTSATFEF